LHNSTKPAQWAADDADFNRGWARIINHSLLVDSGDPRYEVRVHLRPIADKVGFFPRNCM
jgi:hypothetical protein